MLRKVIIFSLFLVALLSALDQPEAVFNLGAGTSRMVTFNYQIKNIAVGNPTLLDVVLLSQRELLLNAKQTGLTTVTIWDNNNIHNYTVAIYKDSEDLSFRTYRLQNISLLKSTITNPTQIGSIDIEPIGGSVDTLKTILSCYLDDTMFAVDAYSNSILVVATERDHQKVEEVLKAYDQKEKMISFAIEVYEIKDTSAFQYQLDIASGTEAVLKTDQSFYGETGGFSPANGLNYAIKTYPYIYSNIGDSTPYLDFIGVTLRYLQTEGKATLLAKPNILTLNNKHAYIMSGEKVPIEQKDSDGNANVQYLPTGVILGMVPRIDDEGNINCWITTQVSSLLADSQNAAGNPVIASRETVNHVRLQDKGTLILGGLIKEDESVIERKIPILGDLLGWVPVLGNFLKNQTIEKSSSELVIILKPEVLAD